VSPSTVSWPRVLSEAAVIVASILLALAADAWWDTRQASQLESDALSALADEVLANQAALRADRETIEADLERLGQFLRSDPATLAAVQPDSVAVWARALSLPTTFDPRSSAASVVSQFTTASREGMVVRQVLSEWLTRVADADEEKQGLRARNEELQERLAPYAARAQQGTSGLGSRIVALGPSVLAELRSDSALVVEVVRKSATQEIYLRNLVALTSVLDSLAATLQVN
jgi:hypothetical protein